MPKVVVITDDAGKRLGQFEAPDGAAAEEIAAHYAQVRGALLAARARREAEQTREAEMRRVEPVTQKIRCTICWEVQPRDDIARHVKEQHAEMWPSDVTK